MFSLCGAEGDPASWVNPRIGASANGHTTAAAAYPFGLVQAGPDTGNFHWDYCSGYRDADRSLYGFSQTHLSGTGCPDLGDLLLLPVTGEAPKERVQVPFLKETEVAEPGHYAVTLADGTRCEAAVTPHGAIWHFTYAKPGAHRLVVDTQWGIMGREDMLRHVKRAEIDMSDARGMSGSLDVSGWVSRTWHFALETDVPRTGAAELPRTETEKGPRYALDFDIPAGGTLTVRLAISANGVAAAKRNLAAELAGRGFDEVKASARAAWNELLSVAEIPGADDAAKTSFYTSLYHLFFQPNDISDCGEKPFYSTLSTWDTFRAAHPLYTIIVPDRVPGMVDSMLEQGRRTGYLPIWTLWGHDNQCMIGTHSIPVIVDWFLKTDGGTLGDRPLPECETVGTDHRAVRIEWESAYAQIKETLTKRHEGRIKERWDLLDKYGYYPFDEIKGESVSRVLECAYDDWCAGVMALRLSEVLGSELDVGSSKSEVESLKSDAAFFFKRSENWRNVFDSTERLVRGRDTKGGWRTPFNPFALGHGADIENDFTEGNSWQYTWHVMQNPEGLVAAFGGKAAFAERLDRLFRLPETVEGMGFTADVSGLIGQYAHGNEPGHHTAYFFQYAGRGDRTAEIVREVFDKFYLPKPDGLCGNDDCGQMSAWYIFSAMGFYPFNPCGGEYVLGAPQLPRVTLNVDSYAARSSNAPYQPCNGRAVSTKPPNTFTVIAKGLSKENKYVKSVTLNGKPLDGFIIRHADVMRGGELVFEMCSAPVWQK